MSVGGRAGCRLSLGRAVARLWTQDTVAANILEAQSLAFKYPYAYKFIVKGTSLENTSYFGSFDYYERKIRVFSSFFQFHMEEVK